MKREITQAIENFILEFHFPVKSNKILFKSFDRENIANEALLDLLHEVKRKRASEFLIRRKEILNIGSFISKNITAYDKLLLLFFFIDNYHSSSTNSIDTNGLRHIYLAGQALEIQVEDVEGAIEFYLNDTVFSDTNSSLYMVNKKDPFIHKHICVNVHRYDRNTITYVKLLNKSGIILTKEFTRENPNHSIAELYSNKMNICVPANYNRNNFGYYSFQELCEEIQNFNPLQFYELSATHKNPKIVLDPELNKIIISGYSIPLSPSNFFSPILEWLKHFKANNRKELDVYIMVDYFNTYTAKFMMRLTRECQLLHNAGCKTNIYWYCDAEDEDMLEFGQNLQCIYKKGIQLCSNNFELVA